MLFLPLAKTFGGYLRPAIGATVNFDGNTSKAYADLRWEIELPSGVFFALGMGAAIHDGELGINTGQKALGSRVLFHPSGELGYRFDGVHSISVFFDHISNGYSRRDNDGMDTIGVRFGRRLVPFSAPPTNDGAIADFSGLYVGAMAGYQLERADWRAPSLSPSRADADDFHWAGLLGYSWQSGRGVFGIEVDASPAARFLSATCVAPSTSCQMDVHGFYSVRPRFGWVIDRAMIYGTGGLAIANWDSTAVNTATGQRLGSISATNFGVAVGAGIELRLTSNLAARAEIMHYGVPGKDLFISGVGTTTDQFQSTAVRAGFSWYFK